MGQRQLSIERKLFFRQWARSPRKMGSIIPSTRALAQALAARVQREPEECVIELGGGTGAITEGLLAAGVPARCLVTIELEASLAGYLRERFPEVRVLQGDATRLDEIVAREGIERVGTVVSGLPMVGMPLEFQRAIVDQGLRMTPNGRQMLQYSYSPVSPVPADKLGIESRRLDFVFWNFPPAYVWGYRRSGTARNERP